MLDIKLIRTNPDMVKQAMRNRGADMDAIIDELLQIDVQRRDVMARAEGMKAKQNDITKQIPRLKKEGADIVSVMDEMKQLSANIKLADAEVSALNEKQNRILMQIPNINHESVPIGKDDSENVEVRRWGTPREFDFEPQPHWDIGAQLDILDPQTAAKVTGARFHFYKKAGAKLERAIMNFFLDTHTANGYTEVRPPFIVNRASMTGTGQLPKFEEDAFKLDGLDYFLVPTAEVPVTNMYRDQILNGAALPLCYCAYTACFRAEAGSAGKDTRGLIRQHEFSKVELVKFTKPEQGYEELEKLTNNAEELLIKLGLPYRVMALCTGDTGFSSAKTYDLEVWLPSYNRYVEISSCSCYSDFQARRANIKYKNDIKDKAQYVYTLNGSGLAVGRTMAAVIENYQNPDGSVTIPEVLRPYMGGTIIARDGTVQ
ncbi:MAG TPA: serine--tRNA ligase [Firmicutes bacterium]|nr:serine--tRNA ligase [Bacillota bacterium]